MITAMQPDEVPSISAGELTDDVILLDVRGDEEWVAGHAPDALHIPADQLADRLDEIPLDGRQVVVVCHGGGRSTRSTVLLNERGRQARKLVGGMPAWAESGRPLTSENGEPPDVD
jgi:rhodanese-related sulfurtransferase